MKKLALFISLAVLSAAAMGQSSATKAVSLDIATYVNVAFNDANTLHISVNDGGTAGTYSGTAGFTVRANAAWSCAVSIPQHPSGSPSAWSWTATTNLTGSGHAATTGAPGTLTVKIAGLTPSNATVKSYANTATVTVTAP